MVRILRALWPIALLLLCRQAWAGASPAEDWRIEHLDKSAAVGAAKVVEIVNTFGDVRTRYAGDDRVSVHGVLQRGPRDPDRPEVEITLDGDVLRVLTVYPKAQQVVSPAVRRDPRRRIDIAVFVPGRLPLRIRTEKGLIESKGHASALDLKSATGNITVVTNATVQASTKRGKIQAIFKNRDWTGDSYLSTVTGDVLLELVGDPDIEVYAETSGAITTDYSIDIKHSPKGRTKYATARIGKHGEHKITLRSANGALTLYRVPLR